MTTIVPKAIPSVGVFMMVVKHTIPKSTKDLGEIVFRSGQCKDQSIYLTYDKSFSYSTNHPVNTVDRARVNLEKPHQDRHISSKAKGDQFEECCIDLQRHFIQRVKLKPGQTMTATWPPSSKPVLFLQLTKVEFCNYNICCGSINILVFWSFVLHTGYLPLLSHVSNGRFEDEISKPFENLFPSASSRCRLTLFACVQCYLILLTTLQ